MTYNHNSIVFDVKLNYEDHQYTAMRICQFISFKPFFFSVRKCLYIQHIKTSRSPREQVCFTARNKSALAAFTEAAHLGTGHPEPLHLPHGKQTDKQTTLNRRSICMYIYLYIYIYLQKNNIHCSFLYNIISVPLAVLGVAISTS